MIRMEGVSKSYQMGEMELPVVRGVGLRVAEAEFVAIIGASGSGKTTLLNLIGCLDTLDAGEYTLAGEPVHSADEDGLATLRRRHIGFVFQLFNLLPRMDAVRNVGLPMVYAGTPPAHRQGQAMRALDRVGLAERAHHLPSQLSGGEQQRVAIARALANEPQILLADEPTGNLDPHTAEGVFALLLELVRGAGLAALIATHNMELAGRMDRSLRLEDGHVVADT